MGGSAFTLTLTISICPWLAACCQAAATFALALGTQGPPPNPRPHCFFVEHWIPDHGCQT